MVTEMDRSDAPHGDTIDEGSTGTAGPTSGAGPSLDVEPPLSPPPPQPLVEHRSSRVELAAGSVRIEIIITAAPATGVQVRPAAPTEEERAVRPWVDDDYTNRTGYRPGFLGPKVELPVLTDDRVAAPTGDGEKALPYQHFSVVMHRTRRLCIFTAANVDGSRAMRRPEPGRSTSRAALAGMDPKKDTEVWFTDPRLAQQYQLPDRFFSRDGGAFDRGHVVMRESVAWGESFLELRRANGDTYHTTNCSPQVAGFNQASRGGRWGQLEKHLASRLEGGRVSVFAGPVLSPSDAWFDGLDDRGPVRVQIPSRFWKVVVGHDGKRLVSFAFLLDQDLSRVQLREEYGIDTAAWSEELISLASLEAELGLITFPRALHEADQHDRDELAHYLDELGLAPP